MKRQQYSPKLGVGTPPSEGLEVLEDLLGAEDLLGGEGEDEKEEDDDDEEDDAEIMLSHGLAELREVLGDLLVAAVAGLQEGDGKEDLFLAAGLL